MHRSRSANVFPDWVEARTVAPRTNDRVHPVEHLRHDAQEVASGLARSWPLSACTQIATMSRTVGVATRDEGIERRTDLLVHGRLVRREDGFDQALTGPEVVVHRGAVALTRERVDLAEADLVDAVLGEEPLPGTDQPGPRPVGSLARDALGSSARRHEMVRAGRAPACATGPEAEHHPLPSVPPPLGYAQPNTLAAVLPAA